MDTDISVPPSLQDLCIEAVAASEFWRVQSRHLEVLSEDHANALISLLIERRIPPTSLYNFRNTSITEISINRGEIGNYGNWVGCMSYLPRLRAIRLRNRSSQKLWWRSIPALVRLAPTLQCLSLDCWSRYGESLSAFQGALESTLAALTSLTELRFSLTCGGNSEVLVNLKHLESLSLLQNLELDNVDLGAPENLSSLVCLTNLHSIAIVSPQKREEKYDYAPGVLYLGSLPKLAHFSFKGPLSSPPVASTLTSLIWKPLGLGKEVDENAKLAWIEIKPKLENLRELDFRSEEEQPEGIAAILESVVAGAAASLTSLHLRSWTLESDGAFLTNCTRLQSLVIQDRKRLPFTSSETMEAWRIFRTFTELPQIIALPALEGFTNLTHLDFNHSVAGCDLEAAVKTIRRLTNLESLELRPALLSTIGDLARGQVLTRLKHLSIVHAYDNYKYVYINYEDEVEEVISSMLPESSEMDSRPMRAGFPSLKNLFIGRYACTLDVWKCVASLTPAVERLSIDVGMFTKVSDRFMFTDLAFDYEGKRDVCEQTHRIVHAFPGLTRLEFGWRRGVQNEPMYILETPQIVQARATASPFEFDVPLVEVEKRYDDNNYSGVDLDYLFRLSPEVLEYDERYRYSSEELREVGERWKKSDQGKREMMKLRGKLTDGDLVL